MAFQDGCASSHIILKMDESYAYCTLSADKPLDAFLADGVAAQRHCTECGTLDESDPEALIFISTLPWLSYTALVQPTPMPADSNPALPGDAAFRKTAARSRRRRRWCTMRCWMACIYRAFIRHWTLS